MNKKDASKLKVGTWISVAWVNAGPTVGLLLEKPVIEKGFSSISLHCFYPNFNQLGKGDINTLATHEQIVEVLGQCAVPEMSITQVCMKRDGPLGNRWVQQAVS